MASRTPAVLTNNQNNEQINFLANPFVQCGFLLVFPIFRTKKEDELQPTRSGVTQTQTQMCHNKSCKWRRIGSSLFTRKSCKLKKIFCPTRQILHLTIWRNWYAAFDGWAPPSPSPYSYWWLQINKDKDITKLAVSFSIPQCSEQIFQGLSTMTVSSRVSKWHIDTLLSSSPWVT